MEQHRLIFEAANEFYGVDMSTANQKLSMTATPPIFTPAAPQISGEQMFASLVENAADMIVRYDAELRCVYCNPAVERQTGARAEKLLGKTPLEAEGRPREQAELIHRSLRQALETGRELQIGQSYPTPAGPKYYQTRIVPEFCPARRVVSLLAITRDLTERRQAEEALRASEARLRHVIASIPEHIYVSTISADGRAVNVYQSPQVEKLTGYPRQRFVEDWSFWLETAIHPADREAARAQLERLLAGQSGTLEYRLLRADGDVTWVRDSARVETEPGGVKTIYGVVMDITEVKRAEDEIRQLNKELEQRIAVRTAELSVRTAELSAANAELLHSSRLKDEFLANMSHALRTPLTGILGLSEALQLGSYGPLPDNQAQILQMIRQSGLHLLDLIVDILDLAKIEAGKVELLLAPTSLADTCQAGLRFIREPALKKKIRVNLTLDPHVSWLQADGRRLKQMLVNLLNNAIKFTPEGGQAGLEVAGDVPQCEVHFTVWDTGIGIPPEKQALLFEPFVQVDGSLSRKYEGAGLGLALTRRLAEMHGGRVSVESQGTDRGSRFTLSLPWQPIDTPAAQPDGKIPSLSTLALPSGRPPLIRLADDNEAA